MGRSSLNMRISQKIVATGPSSISQKRGLTPLPAFPMDAKDIGIYLQAINTVIETCLVTKSSHENAKTDKLRLVIAFLNLYRMIETFSTDEISHELHTLTPSVQIGEKLLHILKFCAIAKDRYDSASTSGEKYYLADTLFDSTSSEEAACMKDFLSHYPPNGETDKPRNEKHRAWSGSDESDDKDGGSTHPDSKTLCVKGSKALSALDLQTIDDVHDTHSSKPRKLSGSGSDHSKESDPSSQGREDFVSLTSATLRRTLKNYWRSKEIGLVVQDEILCSLWDKSIVGKACLSEFLEQAIAFFPIELAFLWDRKTQVVTAFDIGKSHAIEMRDLTEEEKRHYTVIIHNHPHGDTFSLEDLVLCSNREAKEVRAVTISCETPDTMALKSYRCEILDIPGFNAEDRMNLLNAFYLCISNGPEIIKGLRRLDIEPDTLIFRENEFSALESCGLVCFHGSCDHSFRCPDLAILKGIFQDTVQSAKRGITDEQKLAALRYINQ